MKTTEQTSEAVLLNQPGDGVWVMKVVFFFFFLLYLHQVRVVMS